MKFVTNNSSHSTLHTGYKEKCIGGRLNTKFLVLQIDNHLNWKNHIEQLIPKLSGTCCSIRLMVHIRNINTLISIYCAYLHSVIKYGTIFGVTMLSVERFSLCKRKSSELWLVLNPEHHV